MTDKQIAPRLVDGEPVCSDGCECFQPGKFLCMCTVHGANGVYYVAQVDDPCIHGMRQQRDEARGRIAELETVVARQAQHIQDLELFERDNERLRERIERMDAMDEETIHDLELLQDDIEEHLPRYYLDNQDGTEEEANYREVVEYAGDEIKQLRAKLAKAEAEVAGLRRKAGEEGR